MLGLGAGNGQVLADKPAVGFRRLGLGAGSGQVRGDGGRGSADFDAGGGDGAHGAVDTAGEEGHEREAAEIEARGGGETGGQTETDGELYFAVHAVGIGTGHGAGTSGRGGLRCRGSGVGRTGGSSS